MKGFLIDIKKVLFTLVCLTLLIPKAYGLSVYTNKSKYIAPDKIQVQITGDKFSTVRVILKTPDSMVLKLWDLDIGKKGFTTITEALPKNALSGIYKIIVKDTKTKQKSEAIFKVGDFETPSNRQGKGLEETHSKIDLSDLDL